MFQVTVELWADSTASDSHLDLGRAPYVLYGVKYIDLVSRAPFSTVPPAVAA
jgi:hypothetical protein